jgi:hypothetical protein
MSFAKSAPDHVNPSRGSIGDRVERCSHIWRQRHRPQSVEPPILICQLAEVFDAPGPIASETVHPTAPLCPFRVCVELRSFDKPSARRRRAKKRPKQPGPLNGRRKGGGRIVRPGTPSTYRSWSQRKTQ